MLCVASADGAAAGAGGRAVAGGGEAGAAAACVAGRVCRWPRRARGRGAEAPCVTTCCWGGRCARRDTHACCPRAACAGDLRRLPRGDESPVGERGSALSGGQARAPQPRHVLLPTTSRNPPRTSLASKFTCGGVGRCGDEFEHISVRGAPCLSPGIPLLLCKGLGVVMKSAVTNVSQERVRGGSKELFVIYVPCVKGSMLSESELWTCVAGRCTRRRTCTWL